MGNATPIRIQRSRQHKQVSPNGLPIVYIGRPSKWGNQYRAVRDIVYEFCHNRTVLDKWTVKEVCHSEEEAKRRAVELYQDDIYHYKTHKDGFDSLLITQAIIDGIKSELKGKNLSCWCKIGEPCHGDVLLEIANK